MGDLPRTEAGDAEVQELARCLYNGGDRLHRFDQLMKQCPDRLREPLIEQAFHSLYGYLDNPQHWVERLPLVGDSARPKAAEELAQAWAKQAPEEAAAWQASLAQGDSRNSAAGGIALGWAREDSHGAAEWVQSLPAGGEYDKAAAGMVLALAGQSPQQAWDWALTITDDNQRKQAATRAANAMFQRDPATARQWIDAAPLTPDAKTELLSTLGKPMKHAR